MTNKFLREDGSWVEPEGAGPGGATDTADVQLGFETVIHEGNEFSPGDRLDAFLKLLVSTLNSVYESADSQDIRIAQLRSRINALDGLDDDDEEAPPED